VSEANNLRNLQLALA